MCNIVAQCSVPIVSQVEQSPSTDMNGTAINTADSVIAKNVDNVVAGESSKSKSRRLTHLFPLHGHFMMSALRDIEEEQQRLSTAISSLKVNSCFY